MIANTISSHVLGFPRIGANRETKKALEAYWQGEMDQTTLLAMSAAVKATMWQAQQQAGLTYVTVGDFAFYDHILNHSAMFGVIPERFNHTFGDTVDLDTIFRVARGRAPSGAPANASEMTKWFDTNYHYIVPELNNDQQFTLSYHALFDDIDQAKTAGYSVKPALIGPVTYLYLSKCAHQNFDKTQLLDGLLSVYEEILAMLAARDIEWVQIDEPIVAFDLAPEWREALQHSYTRLASSAPKLLLATYFGRLQENIQLVAQLPVAGIHIDAVRGADETHAMLAACDTQEAISVGIVDGRNIWRNDLRASLAQLSNIQSHLRSHQTLSVASSCSLLHVPVDLKNETALDKDITNWLAFATQKCQEIAALAAALSGNNDAAFFAASEAAATARAQSTKVHNQAVQARGAALTDSLFTRQSPYGVRIAKQRTALELPHFPTTTIGSFPQTNKIRTVRRDFKNGLVDAATYETSMKEEIALTIKKQEEIGLDVLVHGEPERNDMVEYFGELMDGYAFTQNGWVQSYGSRCVKPPIIYGDVSRNVPMTVNWSSYAQSLSDKHVKGMLTGPITMLFWSFVRDDLPKDQVCYQIALALRDEVLDLEKAGISIIQIDEPAFREGLPLRRSEWQQYLDWAVRSFHLSANGVQDATQIHTHMCYSEFNDIIESIAALDADVITIETSRSNMELLDAFKHFQYPNDIGPGVYDIHSPNIPAVDDMIALMTEATKRVNIDKLWVNPDCGLKTRNWEEVEPALVNMVKSAQQLRQNFASA